MGLVCRERSDRGQWRDPGPRMIVTPEDVVSMVGGPYRPSDRWTGGSGASATSLPSSLPSPGTGRSV
jgi:hypothetical protein